RSRPPTPRPSIPTRRSSDLTSARAFSATVDALGKLVQMLGVPPQELWERIPGVTRQDVERWKATAQQGDSFAFLANLLEQQAAEDRKSTRLNSSHVKISYAV